MSKPYRSIRDWAPQESHEEAVSRIESILAELDSRSNPHLGCGPDEEFFDYPAMIQENGRNRKKSTR
jgi:hypothetical protein